MKMRNRNILRRLCLWAGAALVLIAGVTLALWLREIHNSREITADRVHTLQMLMPAPRGAFPEERQNNEMPAVSLEGTDFIGLLELPRYGSTLPVCSQWGAFSPYPCRLGGSLYDGSLQIGGSTRAGQYDFYREISVGDMVYFTDMTGNRYSYVVKEIRYEKHADQTALTSVPAALTLFLKNDYAFEYIMIFCDFSS